MFVSSSDVDGADTQYCSTCFLDIDRSVKRNTTIDQKIIISVGHRVLAWECFRHPENIKNVVNTNARE